MDGKEFKQLVINSGLSYSDLITDTSKALNYFRNLADSLMDSDLSYVNFLNDLIVNIWRCKGNTINLPIHKLPEILKVKLLRSLISGKPIKTYRSTENILDLGIYDDYLLINVYSQKSDDTYLIMNGNKFCNLVSSL